MDKLLIIDDDAKICSFLLLFAQEWGHLASKAGSAREGLALALKEHYDLILLDLDLPDSNGLRILPDLIEAPSHPEVIIITGTGDINGAKLAFQYGAWDFVSKPFTMEEIALPVSRALAYRKEKRALLTPFTLKRDPIIGSSQVIRNCLDDVARAATTEASVLIIGETGTGKELFARAIHENSRRAGPGSSRWTAGRFRNRWPKAFSSVTKRAPSPVPRRARRASSPRPPEAPFFLTKSAICPSTPRRRSCAPFRSGASDRSAPLRSTGGFPGGGRHQP
jgi:DNA-binding response OmpR family regulator